MLSHEIIQLTAAKSAPADERLLVRRQDLDVHIRSANSTSVTDQEFIGLFSEYLATTKMRKMQFNGLFSVLSQTSTDFAKTRRFQPG